MVAITPSNGMRLFERTKMIVVKVGSSLLVDDDKSVINTAWLEGISGDIAALRAAGKNVVVVSSGAIALGCKLLHMQNGKLKLQEKTLHIHSAGFREKPIACRPTSTACRRRSSRYD